MYTIDYLDGLYCVFKTERIGLRIIAAFETEAEAQNAIVRYREEKI